MKTQSVVRSVGFVLGFFFVLNAHAATVSSVSVGPQSPASINPGGTATYVVSVTRVGSGNVEAYLSSLSLPSGATATFSPLSEQPLRTRMD